MNITKTDNLEIKTILNHEKGSLVTNGNVHAKTMNIESRKNNIKGNLQVEGNVSFGEGSLTIDGNTEITQGNLHMKNDSDNLLVKGNLILGEDYGTNSEYEMTEGTVEVKGDFTSKYKRDYRSYGYYETLNHKTIFSGDKTQKISFTQACNVNGFNENLELENNDINFATPIYDVKINQDTELTNTKELVVTGTLDSGDYKFTTTGNVEAERFNTRGKEVDIEGNVKAGILYITGNNNQTHGNLKTTDRVIFDEGNLSVDGDMEMEKGHLYMTKDSDKLLVKGNLILGEGYGTNSEHEMTAGTVEVKGDFTSKYKRDNSSYGYYETEEHKTIFSGDKTQKISFVQACNVNGFNENLELVNNDINFATSIYDVKINQDTELTNTKELVVIGTLDSGDYKFTTTGNVEAERFNTRGKEVDIEGNVKAGILYITGNNNQTHGNLKTTDRVIFDEGNLSVDGDMEMEKGHLYMTKDSDKLLVKGNLILGEGYGTNSEHEMTAGTVEVKGNFTSKYKRDNSPYGYYETANHKTVFSGDKTQKISFVESSEVNQFNGNLELKNPEINFATPIY